MPTRGNVHDIVIGQQTKISYTPFQLRILSGLNVGNVYYVDSNGGGSDAAGAGGTFNEPFLTLNGAINAIATLITNGVSTANQGDVIYLKPGHVETVAAAAGLATDSAGLTILGLGTGSARPQVNFTATDATMTMTAANTYIENVLFTGGIDAVATAIVISGADNSLINCETRDVTGQATNWITTTAAADRLSIIGHVHRGAAAAGGVTWLSIVGGDGIYVQPRWVDGNFSTACINNVTTAATNLTFCGAGDAPAFMRNRNAADVIFTALTTTTGNVGPHIYARLADNAANIDEAHVGADMQFYPPIGIVNLDSESAHVTAAGTIMDNTTPSTDA